MNTQSKKSRRHIVQAVVLLICFFITIKANAQVPTDNDPAAKEIIGLMQNSASEWNKGNLKAFMSLYDPSATMLSRCLFPDMPGQYQNPLVWHLKERDTHLVVASGRNALNAG
jgi:hypothetical protein